MKSVSFRLCVSFALLGACQGAPGNSGERAANGASTGGEQRAPLAIHTVASSPAGISANAYLIEAEHEVVAVDSALTVSEAKRVREKLDRLGKPLAAVLLTHGHPDHYNGVAALVAGKGEVPIYATAAVAKVIRDDDAAKAAQWTPRFGAEWPTARVFPNRELKSGEVVRVAELEFRVVELGPGESHADSYWLLEGERPQAFIGDVVLHQEHAYVSDGHTREWLANLARLEDELREVGVLYPGHGSAGGPELLRWQADYLRAYRGEVERLRKGGDRLGEPEKQELTSSMKEKYADAGLDFLIALGADAVAKELAMEHE